LSLLAQVAVVEGEHLVGAGQGGGAVGDHQERRLLVSELRQLSPEFGRWRDGHDVRENRTRLRRFRHPELGEQVMRLIVVRAPEFEPWIVVFHLPA
jgi:hypothetical protein